MHASKRLDTESQTDGNIQRRIKRAELSRLQCLSIKRMLCDSNASGTTNKWEK